MSFFIDLVADLWRPQSELPAMAALGDVPQKTSSHQQKVFFLHNRKDIVILLLMDGHKLINPVAIFDRFPPNSRHQAGAGCSSMVFLTPHSCLFFFVSVAIQTSSLSELTVSNVCCEVYNVFSCNYLELAGADGGTVLQEPLPLASNNSIQPLKLWQSNNWSWTYWKHFNRSHVNVRQLKMIKYQLDITSGHRLLGGDPFT